MSGNPLFISIFSRATSQPLTSILRTQRGPSSGTDPRDGLFPDGTAPGKGISDPGPKWPDHSLRRPPVWVSS